MAKFTFNLERPARKSGGDRYECGEDPDWKVYFPQKISRPEGQPIATLVVEISHGK
jgi:hypothetical protein